MCVRGCRKVFNRFAANALRWGANPIRIAYVWLSVPAVPANRSFGGGTVAFVVHAIHLIRGEPARPGVRAQDIHGVWQRCAIRSASGTRVPVNDAAFQIVAAREGSKRGPTFSTTE